MEIRKTVVHHVLLFRFDEIPFSLLIQQNHAEKIVALFDFGQIGVTPGEQAGKPKIVFQIGSLRDEFGEHAISQLAIEERKILLEIDGTTDDADRVMSRLKMHIAELAGRSDSEFLAPIVKAEESEIVARLDFSADKLISPALLRLVEANTSRMEYKGLATARANLERVSFVVQYLTDDLKLDDHRIALSRKEFMIGPRPGFPLSEQIYYSKAPVDTMTHRAILEELENSLK